MYKGPKFEDGPYLQVKFSKKLTLKILYVIIYNRYSLKLLKNIACVANGYSKVGTQSSMLWSSLLESAL